MSLLQIARRRVAYQNTVILIFTSVESVERVSVRIRAVQNGHTERFCLKKWGGVQVKEHYAKRVKILNRPAALDNLCNNGGRHK
jgi:hypothetical protein